MNLFITYCKYEPKTNISFLPQMILSEKQYCWSTFRQTFLVKASISLNRFLIHLLLVQLTDHTRNHKFIIFEAYTNKKYFFHMNNISYVHPLFMILHMLIYFTDLICFVNWNINQEIYMEKWGRMNNSIPLFGFINA